VGVDFQHRILFVGWGKEAERLEKEMRNDDHLPYKIVGCLPSPAGQLCCQPPPTVPVLGDYQNLTTLLQKNSADVVILADLHVKMGEIIGMANLCEMEFAQFKIIPTYFEILASGLQLEKIGGLPILGVTQLPLNRYLSRLIKRGIDIFGAIVGLFVAIPIIIVFGALVYRESPGPILFRQKRVGRNGQAFDILKIRSMRMDAENNGAQWAKQDDPRRLKIGAFMRKWNIDEVPQFFNVLMGEMSLVGPRPERPELISTFKFQIPHYHARHSCLPGMTGWAQVNGLRGNTSLEERIRFDIWYIEKWSVAMDIRIMILTFFNHKNAY
jgi:exopolysaccharide biosynthesis polyprenyl glycosylphosphotransferase